MAALELDPRFRFDSYIVGDGNRLACAAARRVAESPGMSYNPLFIYSASGLGKTHLVTAIGHYAQRIHPDLPVVYDTLEHFMDEVMAAIEAGERDVFRGRFPDAALLLLDDVQFLAGKHRTQDELLRSWDILFAQGGGIVLTSDRPPAEIDGIDERLLSRFSGGLIVDIGAPEYETRVAITRRKAEERNQELAPGVAEALARSAFSNVRELQGALNRLIAVQELEGRAVRADEVPELLGVAGDSGPQTDEFDDFMAGISGTVEEVVAPSPAERQLAAEIQRWEGEGYRTLRLEAALDDPEAVEGGIEALIRQFGTDVDRLREIAGEIEALDPEGPEGERTELLRDPERVGDAEELLEAVRERMRPLPAPPSGYSLPGLRFSPDLFAMRAAAVVADVPAERYNPLFVYGADGVGKSAFLAALGCELREAHPDLMLAYVEGPKLVAELIDAIERNRLESWRERYRRARVLLLDDVDALADTERAQQELFNLFNVLQREGAQLAFAAARSPGELRGIEERLRTRLESGLVVELPESNGESPPPSGPDEAENDDWFQDREKIVWDWPYPEQYLVEELG